MSSLLLLMNGIHLITFGTILFWTAHNRRCMARTLGQYLICLNTMRPRQNGRHFADDTFKRIFLNETFRISIKISLKSVPKGPINNIPALVQIMAWRWSGDKPLSEPMMVRLLTHICVTRPQWVKGGLIRESTHYKDAGWLVMEIPLWK